jgi:hypothetical protein
MPFRQPYHGKARDHLGNRGWPHPKGVGKLGNGQSLSGGEHLQHLLLSGKEAEVGEPAVDASTMQPGRMDERPANALCS